MQLQKTGMSEFEKLKLAKRTTLHGGQKYQDGKANWSKEQMSKDYEEEEVDDEQYGLLHWQQSGGRRDSTALRSTNLLATERDAMYELFQSVEYTQIELYLQNKQHFKALKLLKVVRDAVQFQVGGKQQVNTLSYIWILRTQYQTQLCLINEMQNELAE